MEKISERIEQAAESFLKTGQVNGVDPSELADACSKIIRKQSETSLTRALSTAKKFSKFSVKKDSETKYAALRALARVSHLIGNYQQAKAAYLNARKLAGGNLQEVASIDRALIDLYMYIGDFAESRRRAKMAISAYTKLKVTSDIAKTTVNYANLLHRQDKHRDAEKLYHRASDFFESLGDELSIARCYYNRANSLVQLFDLDKAESLYVKSNEIYLRHEHTIDANDALYGLAWLRMLKGDYHVALLNLTECEKIFQNAGHLRMAALCELDRAEVFLYLNLYTDAYEAAGRAEKVFDKFKIQYESSKAAFYRAKAAHALEQKSEARRSLKKAKRGFIKEENAGFLAAALLLDSQISSAPAKRKKLINAARKKFTTSQLPLWEAICNIYLGSGKTFRNEALSRLQKNAAVHQVPHLFAQWQTLKGDKVFDEGNASGAIRFWKNAADCLDKVRAQLPPVELRTNFGAADLSPHRRLISVESKSSPLQAAIWSERYKTAGVWSPITLKDENSSERVRVEQSLVDLANRVSSYSQHIKGLAGERGNLAPESRKSVLDLQRRVRQEIASIEKTSSGDSGIKDGLFRLYKSESNFQPIVQFHLGYSDILAFVHWRGETILKRYPLGRPLLTRLLRQWRFLLEHELLHKHLGAMPDVEAEYKLFDKLGEWLWKPLEIPIDQRRVLILPEGELANVPWQALRVNSRALLDSYNFILAPSLRHYAYARKVKVNSGQIRVFVGISDDLPQVRRELETLSNLNGRNVSIMNPSLRKDWPSNEEAQLWHYSGHASLRNDNPFYSYLALGDGPLFAADFRLRSSKVELVTLAACRSGEQVALSGEEATGLVRSLLEMGARNVIAGHWPVADDSTALWMHEFYSKYFSGDSLGEAATGASKTVMEKFPSACHWSAFSIFGAGDSSVKYH